LRESSRYHSDRHARRRDRGYRPPERRSRAFAGFPKKAKRLRDIISDEAIERGFCGSLELIDASSLFQLINNITASGLLEINTGDEQVEVFFREGKLIFAQAASNKIKLGSLLVKKGVVSKEKAQEALDIFSEEGGTRKLGRILIDLGYVDKEALQGAIVSQIKIAVCSTLLWKNGHFSFIPDVAPPIDDFILDVNVQHLIIEVLRRSDEMAQPEE
jgi:hypothetical protein